MPIRLAKDITTQARDLLTLADKHYVRALNEINIALQDSKKAMKDSTLASVVLLSFFEVRE